MDFHNENYFIKQISTSCLSQFAYYIQSHNEAIVIDPMREPDQIMQLLNENKANLKYVFETHFHADFISGHSEVSKLTGAQIVFGPSAKPEFDFIPAEDNQVFHFGVMKLKVLHTPGHTLESCCFLLLDKDDNQIAVFTGDTLFLGDTGRPDLAVKGDSDITKETLAGMLYDSVHTKLKILDDSVVIYPGHGAGSACGKNISAGTRCTLGVQKEKNLVFNKNLTRSEFIEIATSDIPTPPQFFFFDVMMNKKGPQCIDTILKNSMVPLHLNDLDKHETAIILDTRDPDQVIKGFIPGSITIPLKMAYATWAATLFPPTKQTQLIIVSEQGKERESIIRLARCGIETVLGYLEGGFETWLKSGREYVTLDCVQAGPAIQEAVEKGEMILDVREKGEWKNTGVLPNSMLCPLGELERNVTNVDKDKDVFLLCRTAMRALVAGSILRRNGFKNRLVLISGGMVKVMEADQKTLIKNYEN